VTMDIVPLYLLPYFLPAPPSSPANKPGCLHRVWRLREPVVGKWALSWYTADEDVDDRDGSADCAGLV
jgi:hypothetical protein